MSRGSKLIVVITITNNWLIVDVVNDLVFGILENIFVLESASFSYNWTGFLLYLKVGVSPRIPGFNPFTWPKSTMEAPD